MLSQLEAELNSFKARFVPEQNQETFFKSIDDFVGYLKKSGNADWIISDVLYFALDQTRSFRLRRLYEGEQQRSPDYTHVVVRQTVPNHHDKHYILDQRKGATLDKLASFDSEELAMVLWNKLEADPPMFSFMDAVNEAAALESVLMANEAGVQ